MEQHPGQVFGRLLKAGLPGTDPFGKAERRLHDLRSGEPLSTRMSFEDLAVQFEGSTASGAERAYRRAVEHLALVC